MSGYREVPALGDWVLDQGEDIVPPVSVGFEGLLDALEALSDDHQMLIEAIYWERLSYSELAARLGLGAKQAAYDRVQRAVTALGKELEDRGYRPREELT